MLYIGFKYIKIETAKGCWNKLELEHVFTKKYKYQMFPFTQNLQQIKYHI